ncbi:MULTISPECIES: 4-fold beta flower protein [Microbacterium]|jgi:hypothetical protein|uniref:4-fold beta flower protein n=1 Tax=Microbacterium TaxID=33882 RepID=UPI0026E97F56|nr:MULTISPECIES: hypothetical protein [Microbacterium]
MEPIYDSRGSVVAWFEDPDCVRDLDGAVIGWLYDDAVHATNGRHVGYFNDGLFRDNDGDVVAWVDGASGGPIKPIREIRPVQPIRHISPIRPIREVRNVRAVRSLGWSRLSMKQYLSER